MPKILLLNGPNINLIGTYNVDMFGATTLTDIENKLKKMSNDAGHEFSCLQSNSESELIDRIQLTIRDQTKFIILNPGGLAYSSISLRDTLSASTIPFIEVHLSNIFKREPFRAKSYFTDIAIGFIVGLGSKTYELAMLAAIDFLESKK